MLICLYFGKMEPKKTLFLNWSEFQNNAANSFQDVRLSLKYSDVTLAFEDSPTLIEAHKVLLASGSTFFQRVLDQIPAHTTCSSCLAWAGGRWRPGLDFLYTGQARLPQGDLQEFLQAAQTLGVRGLQKTGQEGATDRYSTVNNIFLIMILTLMTPWQVRVTRGKLNLLLILVANSPHR